MFGMSLFSFIRFGLVVRLLRKRIEERRHLLPKLNISDYVWCRIPLGFWSVPMNDSQSVDPYVPGAWPYLLRALNWAKNNSLHVIVDLHGAPGSQNGYDNSGQRTNNPVWAVDSDNVNRTIQILSFVASEIGGMIDVLELLNEPAGFTSDAWAATIRQFWSDAYDAVRSAAGAQMKIMIGDAFLGVQSWTDFLTYPEAQGVLMDYVRERSAQSPHK